MKRGPGGFWPVTTEVFAPRDDNNNEVEVVFELPRGFIPEYIEYKWCARATLSFDNPETAEQAAPSRGTASAEPTQRTVTVSDAGGTVPNSGRGGNVRAFTTRSGQSFFGDRMPVAMKAYRRYRNAEVTRGSLVNGHLVGYLNEQAAGTDREVSTFSVPRDKRLLQLHTEYLQPRSGLGGALSFAVRTLQNFIVEDSNGQQYKVVGKYAIANVQGRDVVEVQYFRDPVGTIGGLGEFELIQNSHYTGDYTFVLLFLVDPGARIVSFSTGGSASRQDDLWGEHLVAPE
jgi:hypothetical protein